MDVRVLHVCVHEGRCGLQSHFIGTEVHHFYLYFTCECTAAEWGHMLAILRYINLTFSIMWNYWRLRYVFRGRFIFCVPPFSKVFLQCNLRWLFMLLWKKNLKQSWLPAFFLGWDNKVILNLWFNLRSTQWVKNYPHTHLKIHNSFNFTSIKVYYFINISLLHAIRRNQVY